MIREFTFQGEPGTEVEDFLRKEHHLGPRQGLKDAFLAGRVQIEGRPARRQSHLNPGDKIRVEMVGLYTPSELSITPADVPGVKLLREGTGFVAIVKPSGVHSHPHHPSEKDTALNWLAKHAPLCAAAANAERPLEGGLVHRLDKGTSGILLAADSAASLHRLRSAWRDPSMEKIYVAKLSGKFNFEGSITAVLSHDPKNAARMTVSATAPRSGAFWDTRTTIRSHACADGTSLALIRIHTGVMHQIRAVCAALGHPVLGDSVYKAAVKKDLVHHDGADAETLARFDRLKSAAEQAFPTTDDGREFWLHALWLRLPAIEGLNEGLVAPVSFGSK